MADAGFFRGTTCEQDSRFKDKQKTLLKQMKFSDSLSTKIDIKKVNIDVLKPWITNRINEILGIEDDVVIEFIFNQLEERHPDPKLMQINLTGFLNAKKSREFMGELWQHLIDAQLSPDGIPPALIELKKEELRKKQRVDDELKETLRRREEKIREEAKDWKPEESDSYSDGRNRNRRREGKSRSRSPADRRNRRDADNTSSPNRSKATEDLVTSSSSAVKNEADSVVSSTTDNKNVDRNADREGDKSLQRSGGRGNGRNFRKRSGSRSPQTRRSRSNEAEKRRRSRSGSRNRRQRYSPPRRQRFSPPPFRRRPPAAFNSRRRSPVERRRSPRRRQSPTPSPPRNSKPIEKPPVKQDVVSRRRSPSSSSASPPPRVAREKDMSPKSNSSRSSKSPTPVKVTNGSAADAIQSRRKVEKARGDSHSPVVPRLVERDYKSATESKTSAKGSRRDPADRDTEGRSKRKRSGSRDSPVSSQKRRLTPTDDKKRDADGKRSRRRSRSVDSKEKRVEKKRDKSSPETGKGLKSPTDRQADKKSAALPDDSTSAKTVEKADDLDDSERKRKHKKHHKKHKKSHKREKSKKGAARSGGSDEETVRSPVKRSEAELRQTALKTLSKRDEEKNSSSDNEHS